jgi:iron only hydrogenase large subunit-like protein
MKYFHSHLIVTKNCTGDMKCVRACPTQALRFRHNKVLLYDDLCVDCGECINVCEENVFVPVIDEISDFDKFKFKIVIPSKIFYSQFPSNIHPAIVHQALKKVGFDVVLDVSQELHEMGFAISEYIKSNPGSMPIISSNCPSVIRLIQVSYPNLMRSISPFDVPREIVAKNAKKTYSEKLGIDINKIGVIYITPCPAKVVSIKQPAEKEKSWIDNAIAINDIYKILLPEILDIQKNNDAKKSGEHFFYCKGWGVLNFLQQTSDFNRYMSVKGIGNIKMILNDIEDSRLQNIDYIEASACTQGCIGGAFCVENPYIAWHNSKLLEKSYGKPFNFNGEEVLKKYKDRFFFFENNLLPRTTRTLSVDLPTSIKRMKQKERIFSKLPGKDCGLCGAPSCETFAEDCARGETDITDCYFFGGSPV